MFERFTERSRSVCARAQEAARERGSAVQTVDLLNALAEDEDGVAGNLLRSSGVTPERIASWPSGLPTDRGSEGKEGFSEDAKHVLDLALRDALALGHNYIGTEHLLLAVSRGEGNGAYMLRGFDIEDDALREAVLGALRSQAKPAVSAVEALKGQDLGEVLEEAVRRAVEQGRSQDAAHFASALASYEQAMTFMRTRAA